MKEFAIASGWYWLILGAVVSYFMGCFHFAKLIAHIKKDDITKEGSGNPGAMNVSRRFGLKIGLVNFFCDALKGVIPVMVGYFVFRGFVFEGTQVNVADFVRYLWAMFAVIGHVFPVTSKFKGGKGVSTTIGLLWASLSCEAWWNVFICLAIFVLLFVYAGITEWGSMGSLMGIAIFTIWQAIIFWLRYEAMLSDVYVVFIFMFLLALNILTWGAHHRNLYHLMVGEEHKTSLKKMLSKKKSTHS